MYTCFNKVNFAWTEVENTLELESPHDWIVNPVFSDPVRATQVPPRLWSYPGGPTIYIPTDQEIDQHPTYLLETKISKINELSLACKNDIISGFESSALGTPHIYDSEEVDQLNLVGSVATTAPTPDTPAGYSIYYAVRDVNTNEKSYQLHTHGQLRQVLADGAQRKLFLLQKFATKRAIVEAQTTVSGVNAITWDSNP